MFCKKNCTKEQPTPWISIDSGEKKNLINLKNITMLCLEDKKIKFSLCDGNTAELNTETPEEAVNTFNTITNVIYSKS